MKAEQPLDGHGAAPVAAMRPAADLAGRIRQSLASGDHGLALQAGPNQTDKDQLDWVKLGQMVSRIADGLTATGVREGATVAIPGRSDLSCAVAVLAVVSSRRCAMIVNPFRTAQAALQAVRELEPDVMLVPESDPIAECAEPGDPIFVMTRDGSLSRMGRLAQEAGRAESRSGILISTSGTTGEPQTIHLPLPVLSQAMSEIEGMHAGFGDRRNADGGWPALIQYSPLAHIGGVLTLLRAAAQGRATAILGKFRAEAWAQTVEQFQPFTTGLPPSMMRMMLEAKIAPECLSSLVSVWTGTAPVRPEERDAFSARYGIPVLGNYGATEFCGAIASWSLDDYRAHFSSHSHAVGRIDPKIARARIRSPEGKLLSKKDAIGVLEFKVRRMGDHWIETNDLGSVDSDGFLTLHGRKDDTIVRGGFKLAPTKISDVLREHPSIRNAAVVGIADARLGQVPVAAVELAENASFDCTEVQDFVRAQLPAYFVPTMILAVDALPRNPAMKLDRRAIAKLFAG